MTNLSQTKALLMCLKKELDGKLECSIEDREKLNALLEELEKAHESELSEAKRQSLIGQALKVLGALVRYFPEIRDFLGL